MPIPDYQSIMLPLLKLISDKKEYSFRFIVDKLAEQMNVSDEERKELLPSGQQEIFSNRVGWARTYLKKAGLLESPKRAAIQITERGLEVLSKNPSEINVKYLKQFPEFIEFQALRKENDKEPDTLDTNVDQTPEESLENAYQSLRKSLANDLLNTVMQLSPSFFEKLVVDLLVKMGYGGSIKDAGKAIGKTGDEGIDGIIKEDKLGLDIIYIQAKKWGSGSVVGRPEIQKFVGALAGQGAKKGIFITTSSFTREAREYQPKNETKIVLIDGEELAQHMIDFNLGVTLSNTYEVKKIDSDYFE
jgi:restriction system protein